MIGVSSVWINLHDLNMEGTWTVGNGTSFDIDCSIIVPTNSLSSTNTEPAQNGGVGITLSTIGIMVSILLSITIS